MAERITSLSPEDLEAFLRLVPRIYCDHRDPHRGPFKIGYVYAQTVDNEQSSFRKAVELARAGLIERIAISEGDRNNGYEGFDHSVRCLRKLGLDGPVLKFDVGGNVNTLSEARLLATQVRGVFGDIAIISPPHHILRATMTTITALVQDENTTVRPYAFPGEPLPWNQEATHSQGTLRDTRAGLLVNELQRLHKYQHPQFGGLLPPSRIIEYLDWRDSQI